MHLDGSLPKERIPLFENHTYEMEHVQIEFKVEHVHYG